ncbi:F0F1 ATP synthase subunit delta [Actibacterium sp. MT2.3-13A]|uniref:F0F1 ATP synthase subunit delta n=1 Tax=Actibacterium sp. MT2.3-13A TaxID=2828332 RepID=UPI001BAA3201|nr:F0F1 ATP synthase subunit delta [Actibacterium sp. MT2.3-13A]
MQIDWITVAAQIVNFLVLVWLLQRLLYRPVTRAMGQRAAAIRAQFDEAARREAEAEAEAERLRLARQELELQRARMLAAAEAEAHELRQRLEAEAREAVAGRRAAWEDQLSREQAAFLSDLQREAAGHVARLSRRVLRDLAGADLEQTIAGIFLARLAALEGEALENLRLAARGAGGAATVSSAFDLPEALRDRVTAAVRDRIAAGLPVTFETDPEMICGLRLKVRGQTLQWSVDAYLDDLEEEMAEVLERSGALDAMNGAG